MQGVQFRNDRYFIDIYVHRCSIYDSTWCGETFIKNFDGYFQVGERLFSFNLHKAIARIHRLQRELTVAKCRVVGKLLSFLFSVYSTLL